MLIYVRGQTQEKMEWRSRSLRLMLDYMQRSEIIEGISRLRISLGLPSQSVARRLAVAMFIRPHLRTQRLGSYQRNDTLNYCLECLMGVVLELLRGWSITTRISF